MSDTITVQMQLLHQTAAAVLVTDSTPDEGVWLPNSQIEMSVNDPVPGIVSITLPEWLAVQKGLV
jgi:hypothetical protein